MVCFLFLLLISALLKKRLLHLESLTFYLWLSQVQRSKTGALRAFFCLRIGALGPRCRGALNLE